MYSNSEKESVMAKSIAIDIAQLESVLHCADACLGQIFSCFPLPCSHSYLALRNTINLTSFLFWPIIFCFVLELSEIPFCELEELKHKVGSKRYTWYYFQSLCKLYKHSWSGYQNLNHNPVINNNTIQLILLL